MIVDVPAPNRQSNIGVTAAAIIWALPKMMRMTARPFYPFHVQEPPKQTSSA